MAILFHFNSIKKPTFFKMTPTKTWLTKIASLENYKIKELNYIFLSDEELLKINIDFLKHDTYTDIITFDNSINIGIIESDIFISFERVEVNAIKYKTTVENELHRVMAHGLLHLCGYKDKTKQDVANMRQKEDDALKHFFIL